MKLMKKIVLIFIVITNLSTGFAQEVIYFCSRPIPAGTNGWQVYKRDLNSLTTTTITNNNLYNYWWVELSPNHTQLLMLRSPISSPKDQFDYENCELVKANADGSNEQVIINDNQYGWYAFGNPHWHPLGLNRILMIAQPTNSSSPFYTVTVDLNGNNPSTITSQYSLDANWAPDGNKIVFVGIGAVGTVPINFEIFTANYNYSLNQVSGIQQLTSDATRNQDPCFSPDGTKIVFSASDALLTNADLVTIETSGANRTVIKDDGGIHGGPLNWGSDGNIYHHSIYLSITDFLVSRFNPLTSNNQTLLYLTSQAFISPFYANITPLVVEQYSYPFEKINVLPNPASEILELSFTVKPSKFKIKIFNSYGQLVYENFDNTKVNISNLASGVYQIYIIDINKNYMGRFIKN